LQLSIIIVNYNVKEFLQNLLYSIQKAAKNISHEIIVVDNASDDGSNEMIKEKFPQVILIENKENLGFGKANNIGMRIARGQFFLLINPDTIVSEDTLSKTLEFFRATPDAGLVGCKILNPNGSLQLACRRSFPGPWTSFCKVSGLSNFFPKSSLFARYNLTYKDENKTYEVDAVSGSFMMIKKEIYEKTSGFDEDYFMYGEDLDICYRIQKLGYKVYYFHETQIIHYKGESTKRSSVDETKYFYNAMHLFVKKHFSTYFLVETILRSAIWFREFFAFLGRKKFEILFIVLDFIFFDLSLFAAEKIYSVFSHWRGFTNDVYRIVYIFPALIQLIVSSIWGGYKSYKLSILKNFAAVFIGFVFLSAVTYFFKQYAYSRAVVIITYLIFFFAGSFWRIVIKLFSNIGGAGRLSTKRTLIVGTNNIAVQVAKKVQQRQNDYHTVNGLVGVSHADVGKKIQGLEIIGTIDNINKVIAERKVGEVIFIPDEVSYTKMMSIVSNNQNKNVEFKLIGNNLDFLVGKASVLLLDDFSLIDIQYNISKPTLRFIKNLFDFLLAVFVLFFMYPFIYLIQKQKNKNSDFSNFILGVPSIIKGKTSFVGPKNPELYKNLFLGKKGLTGLWFIENALDEESEKLDIFYARNQSIWMDLEILGKTINKFWKTENTNG
jgi:GT2 family glycosyltransferase